MHYGTGAMWRPLFETQMVPLQTVTGCSHNACLFCNMYANATFQPAPREEISADIEEIAANAPYVQRIFLTGGNALCLPQDSIVTTLREIRERIPSVKTVGCFARVTDVARKTDDELAELAELGLADISIGAESGYAPALERMNKGFSVEDTRTQCRRLEAAGLPYSLFYLIGMAGAGHCVEAADATVALYGELHPAHVMIHTMTPFRGTKLRAEIEAGLFEQADELEILAELRRFVETIDIETVLIGNHVGNVVRTSGRLPRDRERLLEAIDEAIAYSREPALKAFRASQRSM